MERFGGIALDRRTVALKPGDTIGEPMDNSNFISLNRNKLQLGEIIQIFPPKYQIFGTMKGAIGSGFYASRFGPLPFSIGPVSSEVVAIYTLLP
jgi:hypothetical protein